MLVEVTKDNIFIQNKTNVRVHSGEHKVNKLEFEFSEDYTPDLTLKALFTVGENSYETPIINGGCYIPSEVLISENYVTVGVYAYKIVDGNVDLRYSPLPTYFRVLEGSYKPNAQTSEELTPTQFEQYTNALNEGLRQVQDSINELDKATDSANKLVDEINQKLANGEFNGRDGKDGKDGPQGEPGKDNTEELDKIVPKQNVSDSIISVDDALDYKVFEFEVDGKHTQETTQGYNLLNNQLQSQTVNGVTISVGKDKSIKLTGTAQVRVEPILWQKSENETLKLKANTTYYNTTSRTIYFYANKYYSMVPNESITPTENIDISKVYIRVEANESVNETIYPQLTTVKDASYEPYTGGIPSPNSEYPQGIKTFSGVNIYNIDEYPLELGNFNYISGSNYADDTSVRSKDYFPIEDSSDNLYIYISGLTSSNKVACIFYDKNKVKVEEGKDKTPNGNNVSFAIPSGAKYCKFRISNLTNLTPEIAISYSDTNSYLPYDTIKIKKASKNQAYTGWADEFVAKVNDSSKAALEVKDNRNCLKFSPYAWKKGNLLNLKYKENTQYTIMFDFFIMSGGNSNIAFYYTDGTNSIMPYDKPNVGAWKNRKFSSAKNKTVAYIDVNWTDVNINYIDIDTFMVYEGTDDLPYEPYKGEDYQIDLKGNEMLTGDNLVIDKNGNVSLIKKWAKSNIVLNGEFFDSSYGLRWYWFTKPTNSKDYGTFLTNAICTVAQAKPYKSLPVYFGGNGNHHKYAIVYDSSQVDLLTVEELKALVDGTVYYYELAEPKIIDLGKIEPIETFEGSNTFTVIGNLDTQASMTYALDMKKYTDKKIEELKSTIVSANV